MKIKFEPDLDFQAEALRSVCDVFEGQEICQTNFTVPALESNDQWNLINTDLGIGNRIRLLSEDVLANLNAVQVRNGLKPSAILGDLNFTIEMETGTGKTYCYIKTIFEMNKRYGWSKFIIMVPSIAIREGVYKSLQITAEHFTESYGKKARFFIYNSKRLHELESFSSDAGINVMVMNIQAFNARGADNRRIYDELDDFQSRKPIDVIAANRPILILDESQNTTVSQMKMFLTRLGYNSTAVITGDITQVDLPGSTRSGLRHAIEVLKDIEGIGFTFFQAKDVVRHSLVQKVILAYEKAETKS
mgnify:CR=1 FL=1